MFCKVKVDIYSTVVICIIVSNVKLDSNWIQHAITSNVGDYNLQSLSVVKSDRKENMHLTWIDVSY